MLTSNLKFWNILHHYVNERLLLHFNIFILSMLITYVYIYIFAFVFFPTRLTKEEQKRKKGNKKLAEDSTIFDLSIKPGLLGCIS